MVAFCQQGGRGIYLARKTRPTWKDIQGDQILPQLFNVLKGDMALIGPRPLLPQYLTLYSKEQARRHEVCPGFSSWAQCHG